MACRNSELNCIVCLIHPFILYGMFTGSINVNCYCPHLNNTKNASFFEFSKLKCILSLFPFGMMLLSVEILAVNALQYRVELNLKFIHSLFDLLYFGGICVFFLISYTQFDKSTSVVQFYQKIIDKHNIYGVPLMLTIKDRRHIRNYIRNTTIFLTLLLIFYTIAAFSNIIYKYRLDPLIEIGKIISGYCSMHMMHVVFLYFKLTAILFKNCHNRIKVILLEALNRRKSLLHHDNNGGPVDLVHHLEMLQNLHIEIHKAIGKVADSIAPSTPLAVVFLEAGLTLCFYVYVKHLIIEKIFTDFVIVATVLSGVFLYVFSYTYVVFQDLFNINDDILSFLFTLPINRFNRYERDQMELLISTLMHKKPEFSGSHFLQLRLHTVASMIGVVITYVLVLLQFRTTWIE